MDIQDRRVGEVTVITPNGSLDAVTAPRLAEHIQRLIDDGHSRLVADLASVDYTSSAGLRVLLGAAKETRSHGGDIRLAGVQPNVLKVLSLSGFTSILKLFDDVDSAIPSYA